MKNQIDRKCIFLGRAVHAPSKEWSAGCGFNVFDILCGIIRQKTTYSNIVIVFTGWKSEGNLLPPL